ncbi:unnamed protein product [Callosobruchus maculatus]|uniref:Uncharacterized protein n=1 Tax=Callosobruchus maculatus TaxID=64391 RepID=A0A653BH83_CALMS|nr:unnamed protein product [Callosobruchus maculatus]
MHKGLNNRSKSFQVSVKHLDNTDLFLHTSNFDIMLFRSTT